MLTVLFPQTLKNKTTTTAPPQPQKHNHNQNATKKHNHKNTKKDNTTTKTSPHHHKITKTQPQKHHHTNTKSQKHNHTTTKTQPHHHKHTTKPPQKHDHTTTKTQRHTTTKTQRHTTTKTPPHHHKNTTTPPQKHNHTTSKSQKHQYQSWMTSTPSRCLLVWHIHIYSSLYIYEASWFVLSTSWTPKFQVSTPTSRTKSHKNCGMSARTCQARRTPSLGFPYLVVCYNHVFNCSSYNGKLSQLVKIWVKLSIWMFIKYVDPSFQMPVTRDFLMLLTWLLIWEFSQSSYIYWPEKNCLTSLNSKSQCPFEDGQYK